MAEAEEPLEIVLPTAPKVSGTRLAAGTLVVVAVLGGLFVMRLIPSRRQKAALAEQVSSRSQDRPRVEVVSPRALDGQRSLVLPGNDKPHPPSAGLEPDGSHLPSRPGEPGAQIPRNAKGGCS